MVEFFVSLYQFFVKFLESSIWNPIGNFFAFFGIISAIFFLVRARHNSKIKEWNDNISIKDYGADYDLEKTEKSPIYSKIWDDESSFSKIIVFKPVNCIIPKFKVMQVNPLNLKRKTIEAFKDISPETPFCIKVERAETIPSYCLRWYSDYGEYYDYEITENGRNGINTIEGVIYNKNIITRIRRLLEWK